MKKYEISELLLAERVAKTALKKYMDIGRHYKDIYNSVKEDLIRFGSGLRGGQLPTGQPNQLTGGKDDN